MAQVSYGTITITDTNDINRIYVEYCRSTSNQLSGSTVPGITVNWSESTPAWVDGQYLWQRAVIEKSGTLEKTYGTPVCITGAQGETGSQGSTGAAGRSLTSTTTQYTTAATNATITQSNMGNYTWSSNVPDYNANTPAYWVRITNIYSNPSSTEYIIYKDNGITDAVKTSHDANTTAAAANSTANTANQTANTANSTANSANTKADQAVTNVNNLQNKLKYYWVNEVAHTNGVNGWTKPNYPAGTYAASGIDGTTFDTENSSTYGYNTWYANGINLRYNAIKLGELTGSALTFYQPSTTNQGAKAMELSGSALKFYASNGTTVQAEFGGSKAQVSGTINAYDGQIGNSEDNYWYIGNYLDYFENQSAIIKSHGTASIQLGDSNTWRIATNRIHTAWNNDSSSGDAFKLHFPVYDNKYWDSGLHLPTSANDKLLYIRNSSSSNTLTYLNEALEDQYTNRWNYLFYITNSGSIYAKNIYVLDDNGQATQIGGTDGVYLLKSGGTITGNLEVNGTLTKSSKNVAYLTATPTSGQILIADGTSGGIKTSGYTIAKSVPSNALFTDENVKSTEANTTKLWLVGSDTSGTRTGALKYDSGVYITTTAGTVHATTFEGNLSGTASRATADGDGNTIKTTYLKLSGGNVTGAVTFGSSVSVDELTAGDLVVNGNASFTNNLQANTINGVAVGSSPKFTDTTYSSLSAVSGGTTVSLVTTGEKYTWNNKQDKLTNPVTGTGTSGYLAKWNGTSTVTTGPALGTDTTKFLNNKGEWAVPAGTYTYTLPLAANGTRGGVQIGYTQSGKNYPVQLSSEKMYVNVPWENTTYSAGTGLSLSGTTFNHSNSVTAGTAGTSGATSSTNRTIAIPYVTYDAQGHITGSGTHTHTIDTYPEAYLAWGGRNITGDITPVGMSISTEHSANRIAYLNPAAITIEYTTNGGSSWSDSGYTNDEKMWLCTGSQSIAVGQSRSGYSQSTALTTNHWTRITLTAQNGSAGYVYTDPRKLLINIGSAVGLNCLIEYKTGASGANWQTFGTYAVSGWSGWNDIPLILGTFGGSSTQTSNNWYLRFTFKVTSTRTDSYKGYSTILGLRLFGTNNWTSASSNNNKGPISSTGHLYSYDTAANATFPAQITATQFNGSLNGNASSASKATNDSDNNPINSTYIKKSVLSGVFDIMYSSAAKTPERLAANTSTTKKFLRMTGTGSAGTAPTWDTVTKSDVGLSNVTNNAQVKGLSSGTTSGHLVTWGSDGYTVGDSGISKSNIVSSIKSNTNGQLVLTYADGNDSSPITVKITATTADSAAYADALSTSGTIITNLGTTGSGAAKTYTSGGDIEPGVKGTLGVGFGGTGKTSWTQWGIVYASATGTLAQVTAGASTNSGYLLQSNGAAAPGWIQATNSNTASTIVKRDASGNFSAGTITATLSGSASKLGTADKGSTTKPIYLSGGSPAEASTYAGGTAVTLNGSGKGASTASFYAPTSYGSSSQVLVGGGQNATPVWTDISGIVPSSATNATNATYATYDASEASNTTKVTIANKYIPKSIGTAAGDIIYWSASGTPTRLAKGSNGQVLKLANGVPSWGTDNNDNTWRAIQVDGTDILGTGTNTNKLNLKAGTNVSLSNSSGTVTITATDVKVTQTNTTGDADYRLLFSENANDTTSTETARKSTYLKFNPSSGLLKTYGISSASGSTPVIYSDVSATEIKAADSSLTTSSSDSDWLKALLIALCTKYPGKTGYIFKGTMSPNSVGWYEVHIYNTSTKDSTTGLPQYSFGRFLKYINNYELFGTASYSYSYRTVDTNTWNALSTSQAGYVSQAPNDTTKFLRGDAQWTQVSSANLSDIRLTWSSSVSTTDWILAHDTAASGTPLFRAMSPANLKTTMSLNNVENTALSTWTGSNKITTLGTITTGTWNGSAIPVANGGTGATTAANARTNLGLGSAATYTASTSVGNNSNLPTGAAVQTYVSGVVGSYVTLGTDQTITANQKTFNGAIRWGTTSKYGAAHYDSTLEAIVFSFV